jgi:hypothetical protein
MSDTSVVALAFSGADFGNAFDGSCNKLSAPKRLALTGAQHAIIRKNGNTKSRIKVVLVSIASPSTNDA